jgi:hypothetical protein
MVLFCSRELSSVGRESIIYARFGFEPQTPQQKRKMDLFFNLNLWSTNYSCWVILTFDFVLFVELLCGDFTHMYFSIFLLGTYYVSLGF